MYIETATKINWEKISKMLGEESILVGYRNSDQHYSGMSCADLAEYLAHDHYTPKGAFVPARPHLQEGLEYNSDIIKDKVRTYFISLFRTGVREGDSVGQVCLDSVKEYLNAGVLKSIAPNAPSTINRKGHDLPDIDVRDLYNHLVYIYIKGHGEELPSPNLQIE